MLIDTAVRSVGGGGLSGSAGGSGGAIHIKANDIHLTDRSVLDVSGGANGGGGGRIFFGISKFFYQ